MSWLKFDILFVNFLNLKKNLINSRIVIRILLLIKFVRYGYLYEETKKIEKTKITLCLLNSCGTMHYNNGLVLRQRQLFTILLDRKSSSVEPKQMQLANCLIKKAPGIIRNPIGAN